MNRKGDNMETDGIERIDELFNEAMRKEKEHSRFIYIGEIYSDV